MCWNAGKQSPIHDHSSANCHFKVIQVRSLLSLIPTPPFPSSPFLIFAISHPRRARRPQGEIFEELYAPAAAAAAPRLLGRATMGPGLVGYINDARGLHRVGNPSPHAPAVSLHLYHPPIRACLTFAPGDAAPGVRREMAFHSVAGVLVRTE